MRVILRRLLFPTLLAAHLFACGGASQAPPVPPLDRCTAPLLAPWPVLIEVDGAFELPEGWTVDQDSVPNGLESLDGGRRIRLSEPSEDAARFALRACLGARDTEPCCASHVATLVRPPSADLAAEPEVGFAGVVQNANRVANAEPDVFAAVLAAALCEADDREACLNALEGADLRSLMDQPDHTNRLRAWILENRGLAPRIPTLRRRFYVLSSGTVTVPTGFQVCSGASALSPVGRAFAPVDVQLAADDESCDDDAFPARLFPIPPDWITNWTALAPARARLSGLNTVRLEFPATVAELRRHLQVRLVGAPAATGTWLDVDGPCGADGCVFEFTRAGALPPSTTGYAVELALAGARHGDQLYGANRAVVGPAVKRAAVANVTVPVIRLDRGIGQFAITRNAATVRIEHPYLQLLGSGEREVTYGNDDDSAAHPVLGSPQARDLRLVGAPRRAVASGAELRLDIDAPGVQGGKVRVQLNIAPCHYRVEQVTALYADMTDAEVVMGVFSDEGACLNQSLRAHATSNDEFALGRSEWRGQAFATPGASTSTASPPGAIGRLLVVHVDKATSANGRLSPDVTLRYANDTSAPRPPPREAEPLTFNLDIRPGLDSGNARASIEIIPNAQTRPHDGTWIENANALVLHHRSFVELDYPEGHLLAYRAYSRTAGAAPCADAIVHGSLDHLPYTRGALPARRVRDRMLGDRLFYCVVPTTTNNNLRVELELTGRLEELLESGRWIPPALHQEQVFAGRRTVELALPSRRLHQPWGLRDRAVLVCDRAPRTEALGTTEAIVMASGEPHEPMRRDEYRACALRVALPHARSCDPGDISALFRRTGAQHLEVALSRRDTAGNTTTTEVTQLRLDEHAMGSLPDLVCSSASEEVLPRRWERETPSDPITGNAEAAPGGFLWIPLPDLVAPIASSLGDFHTISVEVKHTATPFEAIGATPFLDPSTSGNTAATAATDFRTRLRPVNGLTSLLYSHGHTSNGVGPLYSFDVVVGFSALRTPRTGWGITTSSDFDTVESLEFEYGLMLSLEPWNYSTGREYFPIANPQLQFGVLLPKEFDRATIFHSMSLVVGLALRLTPSPRLVANVDTTINATAWWEISAGPRDTVSHALLLGFNGTIKTD